MRRQFLEAGRVVNTHGIQGEVKILPLCDSPDFLAGLKTLYLDDAPVRLLSARVHKGSVLARLEGVETVNDAMRLKNKVLFLNRDETTLPAGSFFLADLIGLEARTEDGTLLGTLSEVLTPPAHNVYVIKGEREYLIPAVPAFIAGVDLAGGTVTVRLIEGM